MRYWRAILVALLPFVVYLIPRSWIFSGEYSLCLFRNLTGHECWGCGITRAVVSLYYFDFHGAWTYHRGIVVVAPLLVYAWFRWIVRLVRETKG